MHVGRFPDSFLLGYPLHSGGLQDLPDPRNQVLGQQPLSSSAKPRFTEAREGEAPDPKDSREDLPTGRKFSAKEGWGKEGLHTLTLEATVKGREAWCRLAGSSKWRALHRTLAIAMTVPSLGQ